MQIRSESYLAMAKRIDWEKRKFDGRKKLSVTDETEFRQQDTAARWLANAEQWEERRKGIIARNRGLGLFGVHKRNKRPKP
jgi:hypothetical protein